MRSDLEKVDGLSHIQTDIQYHICKCRLADSGLDLAAALDDFAKTNRHLQGWSRLEQK